MRRGPTSRQALTCQATRSPASSRIWKRPARLGYDQINLFSESYGTRVAQIYAYMHPDSLHRLVLIGVNTPGHFLYDRAVLDKMIGHLSELCAQDATCSSRTSDFAQTMYDVNHNMPKRWLFFNIDPDTVRLGTQFMLFSNPNMTNLRCLPGSRRRRSFRSGDAEPDGADDVSRGPAHIRRIVQQRRDDRLGQVWRYREHQPGEFDHGRAALRVGLADGRRNGRSS